MASSGLLDGFTKQEDRFCVNHYGNYESLTGAGEACRKDETCQMVVDFNCDNKGYFKLCHSVDKFKHTNIRESYAGSCLYRKGNTLHKQMI